ncbi:VOC family protein [Maribacter sp. ANRC-HE7]|uniref:VOC family protein n=1 Tax=Maribacter aquimaris TaxID=2737171 RepID=A0ABR7V9L2_9FLAO|nr:VOC family protein [Maribacter aquimaris]MBD0780017.1 VOC family protein [Maribacter aquimaris]
MGNPIQNSSFGLDFHHVGVLVTDIVSSLEHFSVVFGKESISEIYEVSTQKVKVCFVKNGENSFLELVQPLGDDSVVSKLLKKRITYYHVAYKVIDIRHSIHQLEELNYKSLDVFNSEAFEGKLCAFLFTPDGHLIELIEK